ncbi:flavin reductase family protein [Nitrospinota bacterium]
MDVQARRTALRMIPYGLYVLTAEGKGGRVAAATINWVTQVSFAPPLVAMGIRAGSAVNAVTKEAGVFALNILGKDQLGTAFTFFRPPERVGDSIGGEAFEMSPGGAPVLKSCPAWVECRLTDTVERGDHSVFVGEVTQAGVRREPDGRPDDSTLWLRDLGDAVFYGG